MNDTSSGPDPDLSIVIPVFNEEGNVGPLVGEIHESLREGPSYEVILVNDGSGDGTEKAVDDVVAADPRVRALHLARNYGQTAALMAGFDNARGDLLLSMDGDGQNDPADIPKFLEAMDDETDLVSGWRRRRSETDPSRLIPSSMANRLTRWWTGVPIHDLGCTMKLYRRAALERVRLYGELHRFIPIFIADEGGRIREIECHHRARRSGRSKYGLNRTLKVALDLVAVKFFVTVKDRPIYLFGTIGLIEFALGTVFVIASIVLKIIDVRDFVETPLPNMGMFLVVLGILTLLMGLLADLTMRTYHESQKKRPYRIRR